MSRVREEGTTRGATCRSGLQACDMPIKATQADQLYTSPWADSHAGGIAPQLLLHIRAPL